MKKLSLLVGALGGTLAGYLFSNKTLRDQLVNAKDPEHAARLLGKHLSRDGKKLAAEVQEFIESDDVQQNIARAKKFAKEKISDAKKELRTIVGSATKKAATAAKSGAKAARSRMSTQTRKVS